MWALLPLCVVAQPATRLRMFVIATYVGYVDHVRDSSVAITRVQIYSLYRANQHMTLQNQHFLGCPSDLHPSPIQQTDEETKACYRCNTAHRYDRWWFAPLETTHMQKSRGPLSSARKSIFSAEARDHPHVASATAAVAVASADLPRNRSSPCCLSGT